MALSSELYIPTAAELKQQMLEDLQLQAMDAGIAEPPIGPGTEWDLLATGVSNIASVLLADVQILDEDADIDRATGAALDEWRVHLELPEVAASVSSGTVTITVVGTTVVPSGLTFQAPNGFTLTTSAGGTVTPPATTITVAAAMNQTGPEGDLALGTRVRLVGGPPNIQTEAVIAVNWSGGTDAEDDTRKRIRCKNRIRNAGSNWGDLRDKALESTGAISDAFIYPALGGPGSAKVVVVSNTSPLTRQVSSTNVAAVQTYIDAAFPDGIWNVIVQSGLNAPCDVALGMALPSTGTHGWLAGGPTNVATVASAVSQTNFVVSFPYGGSIGTLSVGQIIACWDQDAQTVATATVASVSGNAITTYPWEGGNGAIVSHWIFPSIDALEDIVAAWQAIMLLQGPGQNILSTDERYSFARRLPLVSGLAPCELTSLQLLQLQSSVPEATSITYAALSSSTALPALASDPPLVQLLNRFAIYPI